MHVKVKHCQCCKDQRSWTKWITDAIAHILIQFIWLGIRTDFANFYTAILVIMNMAIFSTLIILFTIPLLNYGINAVIKRTELKTTNQLASLVQVAIQELRGEERRPFQQVFPVDPFLTSKLALMKECKRIAELAPFLAEKLNEYSADKVKSIEEEIERTLGDIRNREELLKVIEQNKSKAEDELTKQRNKRNELRKRVAEFDKKLKEYKAALVVSQKGNEDIVREHRKVLQQAEINLRKQKDQLRKKLEEVQSELYKLEKEEVGVWSIWDHTDMD